MPIDKKKVTKATAKYAYRLFERAHQLQRDMYGFRDVLNEKGFEDLAQELEDGAFEMDLTWNNAERVAKRLIEIYVNN